MVEVVGWYPIYRSNMKTLQLTDDLAYRLHTLYEYLDKHQVTSGEDEIEFEAELARELAKEFQKQENEKII